MPTEIVNELKKYMAAHPDFEYTPEIIKGKSKAASSVMQYILEVIEARDTYSQLDELNKHLDQWNEVYKWNLIKINNILNI